MIMILEVRFSVSTEYSTLFVIRRVFHVGGARHLGPHKRFSLRTKCDFLPPKVMLEMRFRYLMIYLLAPSIYGVIGLITMV